MKLVCPSCRFTLIVREYQARERPCPRCKQTGGVATLSRFESFDQVPAYPVAPAPRRAAAS